MPVTNKCFGISLLFISVLSSCMKGDDYYKDCRLNTGNSVMDEQGSVTYAVTGTGNSFVDSIMYQSALGRVVVEKPVLPFSITVQLPQGAIASLAAVGRAIKGGLQANCIINTDSGSSTKQDECSN